MTKGGNSELFPTHIILTFYVFDLAHRIEKRYVTKKTLRYCHFIVAMSFKTIIIIIIVGREISVLEIEQRYVT